MNIGERMKMRRKQLKLSADVVAERLGVSRSTIFRYEKGEIEKLPTNILDDIAKILQTTPAYLMGWESDNISSIETIYNQLIPERQSKVYNFAKHQLDEQTRLQTNNKVVVMMPTRSTTVEIAGKLSAGGGTYNDKNCVETVEVGSTPSHYDLAFQVTGDSMYPTFEDGEIVFVKETNDVYNGQIGAVEINGEAFIKKMYLEGTRLRLVSLNAGVNENGNRLYPDFYSDELDDLYIIGRVII
ncbi:XRE family transcriptional regulator [Enterococcus gilvus]|uniref:XRE family transcriptional regulator n=1 Tax=Enterococcus gilvus TaxID=160453 RepID=UPI001C8C5E7B|nr:XRE family transcriptional regulator [Enterococcus gilvus]MBX8938527.1 helix-turn-helix transcriptional regulator [Enterococcus gilvus]